MPRVCTLCNRPDRLAIEEALAAGEPFRRLARRIGTSVATLQRHKAAHLGQQGRLRGKSEKRSERRLTVRQRKLVKGVAAGKPVLQAAIDAGYSDAAARSVPYRNGGLRTALSTLLDKAGLDDRTLTRELRKLVDAKETKFFAHEGKVQETRRVVSLDAKARGLDMAFKLRGAYPTAEDRAEQAGGGPVMSVQINVVPAHGGQDAGHKERVLDAISITTWRPNNGGEAGSNG